MEHSFDCLCHYAEYLHELESEPEGDDETFFCEYGQYFQGVNCPGNVQEIPEDVRKIFAEEFEKWEYCRRQEELLLS